MSLKAFHIVFISASSLLAFGLGAWALVAFFGTGSITTLAEGLLSLAIGALLIIYGIRFLRKLRHVSFL